MKKLLVVILILFLCFSGYIIYDNYQSNKIPVLTMEESPVSIDEIYTYGTHLNILGSNLTPGNLDLVLYNGTFIPVKLNITDTNFSLSNYVNEGYYMDDLPLGKYYLFIRNTITEEEKTTYKYYPLKNNTNYQETTYYTLSNQNKKITITNEDQYQTTMINVTKNTNKEIYDIVLDPGHGGRDGGASKYGYKETDFTTDLAIKVKNILEKEGLKVKLTRDANTLAKDEKLPEYGIHGRAVIPGEVHAKYLFSFHLNSNIYSSVQGLEVYTPANINYNFAKALVENITTDTDLKISNNKINKVDEGIYTRVFTEEDVNSSIKEMEDEEMLPYEYSTKSNYYYIIRETGGIVTGAYVDNRNEVIAGNPYYNTNTGTEAYLLELGYITNKSDLNNIKDKMDTYASSIARTILTLYPQENHSINE